MTLRGREFIERCNVKLQPHGLFLDVGGLNCPLARKQSFIYTLKFKRLADGKQGKIGTEHGLQNTIFTLAIRELGKILPVCMEFTVTQIKLTLKERI